MAIQLLLETLDDLEEKELKKFKYFLHHDVPDGCRPIPWSHLEKADRMDTAKHIVQAYPLNGLKITVEILQKFNRNDLLGRLKKYSSKEKLCREVADTVPAENSAAFSACSEKEGTSVVIGLSTNNSTQDGPSDEDFRCCKGSLQSILKKKNKKIFEGVVKHDTNKQRGLDEIYAETYVIKGGSGEINTQHEVRQIETLSRKTMKRERAIQFNDMFNHVPGEDPIRTVLTKGVAGIGKTIATQKFSLDWAEEKANLKIHFIFPLLFRELNMSDKNCSLAQLIYRFICQHQGIELTLLERILTEIQKTSHLKSLDEEDSKSNILFIFDGLDEFYKSLDFENGEMWTDAAKPTSVNVLLTNLIRGNLLPSARLWITTRPAAANQIPPEFVDMVTEVQGFTDPQKEEFFKKRFRGEEVMANRVISHIKKSRSLHIMCHIPVFCWIIATVLEHMLTTDKRGELPRTLTQMYTHFLDVQSRNMTLKYQDKKGAAKGENKQTILALGRLAFNQLEKGNLIFYEKDLDACRLDVKTAVESGACTEMFHEDCGVGEEKVYCFTHLTLQEFFAALYVFLMYTNDGVNILEKQQSTLRVIFNKWMFKPATVFHMCAVDTALKSETGHLDLFLRFLLGLSMENNQTRLKNLLTKPWGNVVNQNQDRDTKSPDKTVEYIKKKIRENPSAERTINLFHCLNELNDHSLVREIQQYLRSGTLSRDKLSSAQWSALVFVLLTSEEQLDVFKLKKYSASEEGLFRLLPVVKASTTALLNDCHLSAQCCKELASALKSSDLREMDLSYNDLQDAGIKLLSVGLSDPLCKLETLRLIACALSAQCCEELALVLKSSDLKVLDLSYNDLQDSGVQLLSVGLGDPLCKLETLRLSRCLVTEKSCDSLVSALTSNPSHLRKLDLSYNHPGSSGEKLLSALLDDPHYTLETLLVDHGGEFRIKPGPPKYACELTLDPNTAHRNISLSEENRKVTWRSEEQPYADHPERFDPYPQVLCEDGLTGSRWYWEVEWKGQVSIGVAYKGIKMKGWGNDCGLGYNSKSWNLFCDADIYAVRHNQKRTDLSVSPSSSTRVGVYLDCPGGSLSFYRVASDALTLLHTFNFTFTEPLYPGFGVWVEGSSVSLCQR